MRLGSRRSGTDDRRWECAEKEDEREFITSSRLTYLLHAGGDDAVIGVSNRECCYNNMLPKPDHLRSKKSFWERFSALGKLLVFHLPLLHATTN